MTSAGTTRKDSTTSLRKSRIKDKKKDGIRLEMISKKKVIKKIAKNEKNSEFVDYHGDSSGLPHLKL